MFLSTTNYKNVQKQLEEKNAVKSLEKNFIVFKMHVETH